jgi:heme oxygenase
MASLPESPQRSGRWPSLLVALRQAARPDRARVGAYVGLVERRAGWDAYAGFLSDHRAFTDALGRALDESGTPHAVLRDGPTAEQPESSEPLPMPRTPAQALGYLYVLEAFRLGWAVLARRSRGRSESKHEADEANRAWGALVRALAGVPLDQHAAVVQGAREAYGQWERRLGTKLARLGLAPADARAA